MPAELRTADFDYELPEGRIARRPAARRDESRLLVVEREGGRLEDGRFRDLAERIDPGDALVLNDSRVFPARLIGRKPTGAAAEILLLRPREERGRTPSGPGSGDGPDGASAASRPPVEAFEARSPREWEALVRPGSKLKPGRRVRVADDLELDILDSTPQGGRIVRIVGDDDPWALIERHGRVPLPPYIDRPDEPEDRRRYQTVYARHTGSVAAPTAGLHFTPALLRALGARGVAIVRVTLHVGVGTFRPVESERPEEHRLHGEPFRVDEAAARALEATRTAGGRIWAVGTTVCRVLESVADAEGRVRPTSGWTDLFIHPPYRFRAVDRLVTNFHLPRSSLLMLVSAFAGHELAMRAYAHAVREGYRFYSYGDAMAIL